MNRHIRLVSAIAVALAPLALQATSMDPSSGLVVGASPRQTQSDAMAEALARIGLYRYGTRLQTVVKPSAPIVVVAAAPLVPAPSAPPAAADCGSPVSTPAPAVEEPVAPVVLAASPVPVVPPVVALPIPAEATPSLPSSQVRLQDFFNQVLGARSRLKVVTVTAPPVVIVVPAPVAAAPVMASVTPRAANCAPKKDESVLPAGGPARPAVTPPAALTGLDIEPLTDWFIDFSDPPRGEPEAPMALGFDGPLQFSVQPELLLEDLPDPLAGGNSVPEPGSLALLGLGLLGMGITRRRMAAR